MLPFLFPLIVTFILLLAIFYILLKRCLSSNSSNKYSDSVRFSYPSRIRQRDYYFPKSNPCITYVKRSSTYREHFSDSDFQDESSDFNYPSLPHLASNISNQKGGFKYKIENKKGEEKDSEKKDGERKEQSPLLPT